MRGGAARGITRRNKKQGNQTIGVGSASGGQMVVQVGKVKGQGKIASYLVGTELKNCVLDWGQEREGCRSGCKMVKGKKFLDGIRNRTKHGLRRSKTPPGSQKSRTEKKKGGGVKNCRTSIPKGGGNWGKGKNDGDSLQDYKLTVGSKHGGGGGQRGACGRASCGDYTFSARGTKKVERGGGRPRWSVQTVGRKGRFCNGTTHRLRSKEQPERSKKGGLLTDQ